MTVPDHQLCQLRLLCEVNGVVAILRAISEIVEDPKAAMRIKACTAQLKSSKGDDDGTA